MVRVCKLECSSDGPVEVPDKGKALRVADVVGQRRRGEEKEGERAAVCQYLVGRLLALPGTSTSGSGRGLFHHP